MIASPLALIATAATAVGGVVSAVGQFSAMRAQQSMYEYQAKVAEQQAVAARQYAEYNARVVEMQHEYNAKVAEVQAESRRRIGIMEAQELARRNRQLLAHQTALYSAAGLNLEGTPLIVMGDTAFRAEQDILRSQAGAEYQAGMFESEAGLERLKGQTSAEMIRLSGESRAYEYQTIGSMAGMKSRMYGSSAWYGLGSSLLTTGVETYSMGRKTGLFKDK